MKEVSNGLLMEMNKEYKGNNNLNTLRRALYKNQISTCVFNSEKEIDDGFRFSIDIPTMSATNQKQSGRCWIFSGLNFLREIIAKKYNISDFEFSQNYVSFYDKLEKMNFFLEKFIELKDKDEDDRTLIYLLDGGINDGGQWDMLVNVIRKYGLVCKDAMKESTASSSTRETNILLNWILRKFNCEVRKLKNKKEIDDLKDKTMRDVYNLLCSCFGVPPTEFDFEYVDKDKAYHIEKNIKPLDFYNNYVGDILNDYVSIINAPSSDKKYNTMYTVDFLGNVIEGNEVRYLNLEMNEFKSLILKQLQDQEIVWFGCDCSFFGDRSQGIWDDKLFAYNEAFGINFDIDKGEGLINRYSAMNHAMVLTGVNIFEEKPTKWKIENSWGVDVANKGYYLCSDTWFDKYVYQAVVNKKYLSEEQVKMLNRKLVHLKPWDPMGTLAD